MSKTIEQTPTNRIVDKILNEIKEFESRSIDLTTKVSFSQYEKVEEIRTHQNHGFLTSLAEGQEDDRHFYDIISPMIDSAVSNMDFDTKDFDINSVNGDNIAEVFLAKSELRMYLKQTNQGEKINDFIERFVDEGNIVSRKVGDGEIYSDVDVKNIMPIDQAAKTLEDTDVLEKATMNQTELRRMKEWKNIGKVIKNSNISKKNDTPYYEIFFRFGEITKDELNYVKSELNGTGYEENEEDKDEYVQAQVVMARARTGQKDQNLNQSQGYILYAEALPKEEIKINETLTITKYKPYSEAHFGPYKGRWFREGYREMGMVFQNRANELGNQIRIGMQTSTKLILWSSDENVGGKNILKNIEDGQIIKAEHLGILNNAEKNLAVYAEEWNKNIENARSTLKAFEVATGESLPSSTSATAIAVQDKRVGRYYDFKSEKIGLFFREVFNRWVMPELMKNANAEHFLEISGDPSYMDTYFKALVDGWYVSNLVAIGPHTPEQGEAIKKMKLEEITKKPKQLLKITKDFYKNASMYIDVNITGESVSKQNKISNGLALLNYLVNPNIMQNPQAKKIVIDIANELGYRVENTPEPQMMAAPVTQQQNPPANPTPPAANNLPMTI